jgi:hypothetical protein
MEELLGVVAANLKMQGEEGDAFKREAASALLAYTQDAAAVEVLLDVKGGLLIAAALARTRAGARDGHAALVNVMAAANGRGEPAMDACVTALATDATVDAACVVAAADRFEEKARETALMFLQNLTTRPAGARKVAAREAAATQLLLRFARRGASAAAAVWADGFASCLQNLSAEANFRGLLLRRSSGILAALLPQLLDGYLESHGAASPGKRRGVASALKHCCHDKEEHHHLLRDMYVPEIILFALADAGDIARCAGADHERLAPTGGTNWSRAVRNPNRFKMPSM